MQSVHTQGTAGGGGVPDNRRGEIGGLEKGRKERGCFGRLGARRAPSLPIWLLGPVVSRPEHTPQCELRKGTLPDLAWRMAVRLKVSGGRGEHSRFEGSKEGGMASGGLS
jgi:hypothetical protein